MMNGDDYIAALCLGKGVPPPPFKVEVEWQEQKDSGMEGEFPYCQDKKGTLHFTEAVIMHPFSTFQPIEKLIESAIQNQKPKDVDRIIITKWKIIKDLS